MVATAEELELDRTFAALADPTRRAILRRLASGEATVTELSTPFAMTQPAVSKHLKVLERAGLIERGRERQWRPARLQAKPLQAVAEWTLGYREFWEERYDRLDGVPGGSSGARGREEEGPRGGGGGGG